MKGFTSFLVKARNVMAVLISRKIENHLRWSLVPEESPEESQWHGSDPYITSVINGVSSE